MLLVHLIACAQEPADVPVFAHLKPVGVARPGETAVVPGAPAGCINAVQVAVDPRPCSGIPADAARVRGSWSVTDGELDGVEGWCSFMCDAERGRAQWLIWALTPGWRGEATCTRPGVGQIRVSAADYHDGDDIDPAVAALWLTPEGHASYGIEDIVLPDGTREIGVSTNSCPSGQPVRAL